MAAHTASLQSAMEYLMTYGWAILIIAVILAALFQLGLFSSGSALQRAPPGSCRVLRPGGAGSPSATLEGQCSGTYPEFVPYFGFARGTGSVVIGSMPIDPNSAGITATAWTYWFGPGNGCQGLLGSLPSPGSGFAVFGYGSNNGACGPLWINSSYLKWPSGNYSIPGGRWVFMAVVYNESSGMASMYANMNVFSSATKQSQHVQTSNAFTIGAVVSPSGSIYTFNGLVTNVQIYDAPLSVQELSAMYGEGIAGAPIELQNLVGWWPLNGNAQDYSGNGYDGTAANLTFNSTWASVYPPP